MSSKRKPESIAATDASKGKKQTKGKDWAQNENDNCALIFNESSQQFASETNAT